MLTAAPAFAAEVGIALLPDGRSISTAYSVPIGPKDPQECRDLSLRIDEVRKKLSDAHSECLKTSSSGGFSTHVGPDRCSSPACQSLHSAGSTIAARGEVAACYQQVDEWRKTATPSVTAPDFSHEIRAVARGPVTALRSWIGDKVSFAISDAIGTYGAGPESPQTGTEARKGIPIVSPKDARALTRAAFVTAKVYSITMALQSACRAEGSAVAEVCHDETLQSVRSFSGMARNSTRADPVVRLVQSAMLERLDAVHRQAMASLTDTLAQTGDFRVIDRSEFPNQGSAAAEGPETRVGDSEALIRARREEERRLVREESQRIEDSRARAEQRAQERQRAEATRQVLEAITGGSGGSGSPSSDRRGEKPAEGRRCWSSEVVCSAGDSKCIAALRAERARLPRCKGG